MPSMRYLLIMRRGSIMILHNHSKHKRLIKYGLRLRWPDIQSNKAPTQTTFWIDFLSVIKNPFFLQWYAKRYKQNISAGLIDFCLLQFYFNISFYSADNFEFRNFGF